MFSCKLFWIGQTHNDGGGKNNRDSEGSSANPKPTTISKFRAVIGDCSPAV